MFKFSEKNKLVVSFIVATSFVVSATTLAAEGGISMQGTRIVYPQSARQESLSIHNSSAADSYLVQSWVENAAGHKTQDFVVTPPLYLSAPKNENTLRLMRVGGSLPQDRESLYYFTAKAIPSVDDKKDAGKNVLRVATASRVKLFVRPEGLKPSVDKAPYMLEFTRKGGCLDINNPTPYYITLVDLKAEGSTLHNIMVSPFSHESEPLPNGNVISYSIINDFGAVLKIPDVKIK